MQISYLGHSCFKIETKGNGDNVTIVIDPFEDSLGLKMPKVKADIALVSHDHFDHNNLAAITGQPFVATTSGEFEIKNIFVYGVETFHDAQQGSERGPNTAWRIDAEGLSVVHLGDLGHSLTEKQLEILEGVDILMIPVGGKYTIDAKTASQVVAEIEPRIVIPMHYKVAGLKVDIDPLDAFAKEMGIKTTDQVDKLKINKKDLELEDTKVIILKQS